MRPTPFTSTYSDCNPRGVEKVPSSQRWITSTFKYVKFVKLCKVRADRRGIINVTVYIMFECDHNSGPSELVYLNLVA